MSKGSGIAVKKRPRESFDRTLHRFSKAVEKDKLHKRMIELTYYEKPSDKKRKKRKANKWLRQKGTF